MILKNLLQSPKLISIFRKFKNREIFDILVYGSIVRGKQRVNDIDIAVILRKKIPLDNKLKMAASLRNKLRFLNIELDVKVIDFADLQDIAFVARESIISEGYSILNKSFLHKLFGFNAYVIFYYKLDNLSPSKKKMFYYVLKGRRGEKGILEEKGTQVGNCILKIKLQHSEEFKEILEYHNIEYSTEKILTYS
ncbi:MAG: nucleotidyltransferase domain-containing protein [Nanoarchaeota archaeon]|nr:nucleotidyltransferase domain-containing protein [Nanoarchaeota archaeon]